MKEVALFESALRAAVPVQPEPEIGRALVPRLARVARTATIEAETRASARGTGVAGRHRTRSRRALVARVGIALALIPLILAGLAFAGVTVPGAARDAFDSLGITLPNQPREERAAEPAGERGATQSGAGGSDVSDAARSARQSDVKSNSAAGHQHARQQRAKAKGRAIGHQRGKAIGLNDLTPPGKSGDTGPPAHSNAGGSARSQSVRASGNARGHSEQASPHGKAKGHSK